MKTINIVGEIGWDLLPQSIQKQLNEAAGEDLELNIASPGGYVFDGIEIFNMIRAYKRQYTNSQILANLRGFVASMASYIAMNPAIDILAAENNAIFMIHNVWGMGIGNKNDLRKTADIFDGLDGILNDAYVKKTGKSKKEIAKLMDAESWYYGSEIKDAGFADETIDAPKKEDQNKDVLLSGAKAKIEILKAKLKEKPEPTEKIAAMIKNTQTQTQENSPAPKADENITQESNSMNLDEFRNSSPEAEAEFQAALESAKAQERKDANKNTVEILRLEGVTISEIAAKALDSAMDVNNYALEKLQAEAEKRKNSETQETSEAVFGKITASQTPGEQAAKTEVDMAEYEKGIKEAAIKYAKGGR